MYTRLIFASSGEPIAFLEDNNIFTMEGAWAGLTPNQVDVYDRTGAYVGQLLTDGRIAFDTSRPPPPPVTTPKLAVAKELPYLIPHRPPLPQLPKPYREAVLLAQDSGAKPTSFIATNLALILVFGAVSYFYWQLVGNVPRGLTQWTLNAQAASLLTVIVIAVTAVLSFRALGGSVRRKARLLIVGTQPDRQTVAALLNKIALINFTIVELDSDVLVEDFNAPLVRSITSTKDVDYILFASSINLENGEFRLSPHSYVLSESTKAKIVDIPALLELHGQLDPCAESTRRYFESALPRQWPRYLLDTWAAMVLLMLVAPVMFIAAALIRLDSRGPILNRQERVGLYGRPIYIYKFRTTRLDAAIDGKPSWASPVDSRITRIGRILRSLRIDELPQLFSVLLGDLSMVGPRPERPFFVDQLIASIPAYRWRSLVKPGITGWAQVRYQYGATIEDSHQKLGYDLFYVKHKSVLLDLLIIFETIAVVVTAPPSR